MRTVRGPDGRQWMVRRKLEWSDPATGDDFEHDMEGGRIAAIVIVSTLVVLWVALLAWWLTGDQAVVVPWWFLLIVLGLFAFFPVRWVLRRPRTLVAETPGGADGSRPERWVGWVRGAQAARAETAETIRNLEARATPAYADSPLQPVS